MSSTHGEILYIQLYKEQHRKDVKEKIIFMYVQIVKKKKVKQLLSVCVFVYTQCPRGQFEIN